MKKSVFCFCLLLIFNRAVAQTRDVNKITLGTTYSYVHIDKKLRDLIDAAPKEKYFEEEFFNSMLKNIVTDKKYSDREKVLLFYLMLKKIGYSFAGIEYLPPKQSYYAFHAGKMYILQKTKASLKDLRYNTATLLAVSDSMRTKDAIISSNALLLAMLLNQEQTLKELARISTGETVQTAKNPDIFNHYVCMSASLSQDSALTKNLRKNIFTFTTKEMIEDVLCALYSKNNAVSTIKDYILSEKNMQNNLSIETALCALADKVPSASYQKSIQELIAASGNEKWRSELLKKILDNKIPFNYALTSKDQLIQKVWSNVVLSVYNDGALISNGDILEFDAN